MNTSSAVDRGRGRSRRDLAFTGPLCCRLLSLLKYGLAEPLVEADLAESCICSRNERALAEFGSEVSRVLVDDDLAGVVARAERQTDQLIETELLGAGHFNRAIEWRVHGDPADRLGDVISRHGLNEYRWQPNGRSVGGFIGYARDELEELRRLNDRVRERPTLDQCFLSVLRSEVGAVGVYARFPPLTAPRSASRLRRQRP